MFIDLKQAQIKDLRNSFLEINEVIKELERARNSYLNEIIKRTMVIESKSKDSNKELDPIWGDLFIKE